MSEYLLEIRHQQTEQAEQQAYDTIYSTRGLEQHASFYLWFLDQVLRFGSGRLLDVSCGEGAFLRFARQAGFQAIGIDFSYTALQCTRHEDPDSGVVQANAQRLPFADDTFDVVTNIGSLEHYFDPAAAVREMARVLRPGGVAVVLLPNAFGLFGNITHVLRYGEIYDDGQPLQRYASRASWERLLGQNGLESERVIIYEREIPRTLPDLLRLLRRPWQIIRVLIAPILPVNLGNMLIYICRKSSR